MRLQLYVLIITLRWAAAVLSVVCLFALALQYFQSLNILSDMETGSVFILKYTFMRVPSIVLELFPIVIFATIIFATQQLTRNYEAISIRASGLSFWRMSALPLLLCFLFALIEVSVFQPRALKLYLRAEQDVKGIEGESQSHFKLVNTQEFWFAEKFSDGGALYYFDKLNASTAQDVSIFRFDEQGMVFDRIDAAVATIGAEDLLLNGVKRYIPKGSLQSSKQISLPMGFDLHKAQDIQVEPNFVSFWDLIPLITKLEAQGSDSKRFILELHRHFALPFFYLLTACLGYAVVGLNPRSAAYGVQLGAGFVAAIGIFSSSELISALGATSLLPAILAVWGPLFVALLLLLNYLLGREDG